VIKVAAFPTASKAEGRPKLRIGALSVNAEPSAAFHEKIFSQLTWPGTPRNRRGEENNSIEPSRLVLKPVKAVAE